MKSGPVGIIAEDMSDVKTIHILIERISGKKISEKHHLGYGCGKIISKCKHWTSSLYKRNCKFLIVVHDSDDKSPQEINDKILKELSNSPFTHYLICIPIQEIEAWLLSDPTGIKNAMKLKLLPKIKGNPQNISSPKEYLEDIVKKSSAGTKIYISTKHNEIIAAQISIDEIYRRCEAFRPFHKFITDHVT